MEGIVSQFEHQKGWGFIDFVDRRRAYVHQSQCGGQPLNVGQKVVATLTQDAKNPGKWMAINVLRATSGVREEDGYIEGFVNKWDSRGFGFITLSDGRYAYVHATACGDKHLSPGEVISAVVVPDPKREGGLCAQSVVDGPIGEDGILLEWTEEKGFGFLQMDDGRRAFLHRSAFGAHVSPPSGVKLRVILQEDAKTPGKWSVREVKAAQEGPAPGSPAAQHFNEGERINGTVDKWDPHGFGFLFMEDGRSAYVHASQCNGVSNLTHGECVSALLRPDERGMSKGRWAAFDVLKGRYEGEAASVTDWNATKGYGFVSSDDGKRAYIHRSHFGGTGDLHVGQRLKVKINRDSRNPDKLCVSKVVSMTAEAAEMPVPPVQPPPQAVPSTGLPGSRRMPEAPNLGSGQHLQQLLPPWLS